MQALTAGQSNMQMSVDVVLIKPTHTLLNL